MKAALIAVDLTTGETTTQIFDATVDAAGGPVHAAQELQLGIQDDWPDRHWTIVADTEARKRWSAWQMGDK